LIDELDVSEDLVRRRGTPPAFAVYAKRANG
jgi:hypothetical protein